MGPPCRTLVGASPPPPAEDMCRLPVAALLICSGLVEWGHCDGSLQDSMHELHSRFAVGLYRTLTETENSSNLIVSPLSASASLGLLQLGARGNTLAQLEATLGYNVNGESPHCERELPVPGGVQSGCRCRGYRPCRTQWCLEP